MVLSLWGRHINRKLNKKFWHWLLVSFGEEWMQRANHHFPPQIMMIRARPPIYQLASSIRSTSSPDWLPSEHNRVRPLFSNQGLDDRFFHPSIYPSIHLPTTSPSDLFSHGPSQSMEIDSSPDGHEDDDESIASHRNESRPSTNEPGTQHSFECLRYISRSWSIHIFIALLLRLLTWIQCQEACYDSLQLSSSQVEMLFCWHQRSCEVKIRCW